MKVKIKRNDLASKYQFPKYAKPGDAGIDLTATEIEFEDSTQICYNTGISLEIPEGYVGLVFPRSSIYKKELSLSNSVGVIDSKIENNS